VPVELSPTSIERALALLGEHDLEAPGDVEGALEMIAGREDEEAPVEIGRYDLQLCCSAARRSSPCTPGSGLEPPDTGVLRWRSMIGFEEARLRDRVARELEQWIEGEGVDPRARGFKRRQAALVAEFLQRAQAEVRDPAALHASVAPHLLAADGFAGAAQELAAAALLDGGRVIDRDELLARVHAAIVADGWNAAGEPPDVRDVHVYAWNAIRLAEALELLTYEHEYDRETHISRGELTVTPVGREALWLALRARAVD
jgi:hypothetical protein